MALVIDPVCGMEFDHRSSWSTSVYQDRVYHFCHPVCKEIFDAAPGRFVDPEANSTRAVPRQLGREHAKGQSPIAVRHRNYRGG